MNKIVYKLISVRENAETRGIPILIDEYNASLAYWKELEGLHNLLIKHKEKLQGGTSNQVINSNGNSESADKTNEENTSSQNQVSERSDSVTSTMSIQDQHNQRHNIPPMVPVIELQ